MFQNEQRIGPYALIKEIGRGSFGVVWLAEQRTEFVTTQLAIKLPARGVIDATEFRKEAQIWVQASGHRNVLPLITADIFGEQIVIAIKYAPDGSLAEWLEKRPNGTSIETAVKMIDAVLDGLRHLHSRGIVHRDLKPANILMEGGEPLIADFGLARVLRVDASTFRACGSPAYMAPEIWSIGDRSFPGDLWSVGVIFQELLCGKMPFRGANVAEVERAIRQDPPERMPESIPASIQALVDRALEKDKKQRFQSADEMLAALKALRWERSATARADSDGNVWVKADVCPKCKALAPIRCATCGACFTCLGEKPRWFRKVIFGDGYNCSSCSSENMNSMAAS